MKKIVPFNNVLNFNTDVCEITAISLEHNLNIDSSLISGSFYITGEYKITDGDIKREKFNFDLPFDIALSQNYDMDTLIIDIDDFRYELIDRNKLKVNIDLYLDGEIISESIRTIDENISETDLRGQLEENNTQIINIDTSNLSSESNIVVKNESVELSKENEEEVKKNEKLEKENSEESIISKEVTNEENFEQTTKEITEPISVSIQQRIDLLDEMLANHKEEEMKEENTDNNNNNNNNNNSNVNIFSGFNEDENYVTYRVYRVLETDTIDSILEKYHITKEELANYNNIENIQPGDKLIIPTNDK